MSDQNPERLNQPGVIKDDPANDIVDAEFIDVDDDRARNTSHLGSTVPRRGDTKRGYSRLLWIVPLAFAGIFAYRSIFPTEVTRKTQRSPPATWINLGSCMSTTSLDGAKLLSLADDQSADLTELPPEQSKDAKVNSATGTWSYNEVSKQYAITLNGETVNYFLLSKDSIEGCILVKGTLDNANLRESWFSSPSDDAPPDDSDDR